MTLIFWLQNIIVFVYIHLYTAAVLNLGFAEGFTEVDVDVDWRGFGGRDLIPTHM
jgi:hypothetical protein